MIKLVKKCLPTIIGICFLGTPCIIADVSGGAESHIINALCSIGALIAFSFAICLDGEWHLKDEFRLKSKEKLERMQGIIAMSVFYGVALVGHLFKIGWLIPLYTGKDGLGIGFIPFLLTFVAVGFYTLVYKWIAKKRKNEVGL